MDSIGAEVVAAAVGGAAEDGPGSPLDGPVVHNTGAEAAAAAVGGAAEDGPGSPLARAGRADMQQSEEYELSRGEHAVAQGPTEQPVLLGIINFEGLRVHLQRIRTQKHVLLRRQHHPNLR